MEASPPLAPGPGRIYLDADPPGGDLDLAAASSSAKPRAQWFSSVARGSVAPAACGLPTGTHAAVPLSPCAVSSLSVVCPVSGGEAVLEEECEEQEDLAAGDWAGARACA